MWCDTFFTVITRLGSLYILLPSTALLSLLLLRTGKFREILLLNLSLAAAVILTHAAKVIFRRPRPDSLELLVPMPHDWSFPSAHTAQATAFFLAVTIIASRSLPPPWAGGCAVASTLIIIAVGWSRIYLQVHYLSDVVAGGALAVIVVTAATLLLPYCQNLRGD